MPSFWKHCIACGVVAKLLLKKKNIFETERFFVAGLLHDSGKKFVPRISPAAWKAINLPETIFSEILDEAYLKTSELAGVLVSDTK